MVVGCGTLGNEVLKNLVLMGIGHLVIVDFDVVEESNLTRSILFRKCDVGRRKVDVVHRALLDINPHLDIQSIYGDVAYDVGLGVFRRMDIILGCVDSRWARYCIQRACHRTGKTWIDGGILNLEGTVRTFRPNCNCYACSLGPEGLRELRRRMPCSGVIRRQEQAGHAPTTPIIASVIGAVMVQEACRSARDAQSKCQEGIQRMFYYEGDSMTVQTPVIEAWDADCELHGEWNLDQMATQPYSNPISLWKGMEECTIRLNTPFVDFVIDRKTNEKIEVMAPANIIEGFFEMDNRLRHRLISDFYQHEITELPPGSPLRKMTAKMLGIPAEEILRVKNNDVTNYIIIK